MKTAFDTDSILFALLDGKMSNKGGVYVGDDRPEDSTDEDVVVNTIDLPQDCLPQNGTSNINIYTADTTKKIKGKMQVSANRSRLKVLADEALTIIRNANIKGLKMIPGNMSIMYEPMTKQHFVNIRIDWNIQIN
ncbi:MULTISPECIES: hypothetical protein [Bacteroidales]|uniref:hypothetical protein n=1 Tax=Bacteroides pyogenes TaxID=310300 RepID=UPI002F935E3E